jgi:hypothetical protein
LEVFYTSNIHVYKSARRGEFNGCLDTNIQGEGNMGWRKGALRRNIFGESHSYRDAVERYK